MARSPLSRQGETQKTVCLLGAQWVLMMPVIGTSMGLINYLIRLHSPATDENR